LHKIQDRACGESREIDFLLQSLLVKFRNKLLSQKFIKT